MFDGVSIIKSQKACNNNITKGICFDFPVEFIEILEYETKFYKAQGIFGCTYNKKRN